VTTAARGVTILHWTEREASEWIVRIVVFLAAMLLLGVIVFLMLGLAVTLGAILMITIPADRRGVARFDVWEPLTLG
jgi:hypothetical protein